MRCYTFYTPHTHYALLARKCKRSFLRFGVSINLIEIENKNNWMKNCLSRISILKREADKHPCDDIWIFDSDLECLKYPDLIISALGTSCQNKKYDIATWDKSSIDSGSKTDSSTRFCAGMIGFAPTPAGRACLNRWASKCESDPVPGAFLREQVYLYEAIMADKYLNIFEIPDSYNRHTDRYKNNAESTIIVHHVASRKMRNLIGGDM